MELLSAGFGISRSSGATSARPPSILATQRAELPPSSWRPPAYAIQPLLLPPLPAITNTILRDQARTHKTFFQEASAPKIDHPYEAELQSNRRLEHIGDGALHWCFTRALARRWPQLTSHGLTVLRERITTNNTFSHIAWAYSLDHLLRFHPDSDPTVPISQRQFVLANALEAHIGALAAEDPVWDVNGSVVQWVDAFLESGALVGVEEEVESLLAVNGGCEEGRRSTKRAAEQEVIHRSREKHRGRPHLLSECCSPSSPSEAPVGFPAYQWDDVRGSNDSIWHSTLLANGVELACGHGSKQVHSRHAAMVAFFSGEGFKPFVLQA